MSELEVTLQRFVDTRKKMRQMVKAAPGNPSIYGSWRMKEVLDHITGWDDAVIVSIQAFLAGEKPVVPARHGIDAYNAESVALRAALPLAVSRLEWDFTRAELLRLLADLTDEQLHAPLIMAWGESGSIQVMAEVLIEHEETHANEISMILMGRRN